MSGWITRIAFGAMIGVTMALACVVPKPLITAISVLATLLIVPQMIEDWKNGDYDLAGMIFMKCFTGDILVATEDGDKRIDEICVGDSVWAEDTVTGERVLKRVSKVYVKEADHLIHIGTSTGEDIETTENHPFYVDERGWVAASEVKEGDQLHTEDGRVVTVTYNYDEWLREPVKVYNLEVEGLHTYYVTVDRVLVHNEYDNAGSNTNKNKKTIFDGLKNADVEYKLNPATGKMEPYMKQYQVNDEYKILLRRDFGGFNDHDPLDHWNFEIQTSSGNTKYDLHLYLDELGDLLPFTDDNIYTPKQSPFKK